MKLYVISGLGADRKVFEKIQFNNDLEVIHIDWLIPEKNEDFQHYINRMASVIDNKEPFYLLGYSFGGIIAQEIDKKIPAQKIVILGSIKSDREKSKLMLMGEFSKIHKIVPASFFNEKSTILYTFLRKLFDPKNPKLTQYFRVKDPYYLKWSIEKILNWKFEENPKVVQILADKDIVFPIEKANPNYKIANATHLFPVTKAKEVTKILNEEFKCVKA
ncbi:MAG: alpha/beta hydrolase [Cloacibacterium sp.]|jgi:pimeloyl-ACP methyl ester carboxylesterase|nr:alpha/beta hydrolase [Cloacibacterium sp.]